MSVFSSFCSTICSTKSTGIEVNKEVTSKETIPSLLYVLYYRVVSIGLLDVLKSHNIVNQYNC